jgi:hypothetical protein
MEKGYIVNEPELVTLLKDNIITQLCYDSKLISDELKDKIIGLLMVDIEALYRDTFEGEEIIPEADIEVMLNRIIIKKLKGFSRVV